MHERDIHQDENNCVQMWSAWAPQKLFHAGACSGAGAKCHRYIDDMNIMLPDKHAKKGTPLKLKLRAVVTRRQWSSRYSKKANGKEKKRKAGERERERERERNKQLGGHQRYHIWYRRCYSPLLLYLEKGPTIQCLSPFFFFFHLSIFICMWISP